MCTWYDKNVYLFQCSIYTRLIYSFICALSTIVVFLIRWLFFLWSLYKRRKYSFNHAICTKRCALYKKIYMVTHFTVEDYMCLSHWALYMRRIHVYFVGRFIYTRIYAYSLGDRGGFSVQNMHLIDIFCTRSWKLYTNNLQCKKELLAITFVFNQQYPGRN